MANLQELMQAVIDSTPIKPTVGLYGAWVTPRGGVARYQTIRSTFTLAHVRLEVQRRALIKFPQGFTFSVRPL